MISSIKDRTINGLLWSFIESFSLKGIQFIIGVVMARFLFPADYGLIAMLAIFLGISGIFIDGGFTTALIQKKDRTELDFCTIYYFNILASLVIYLMLFIAAPLIATFYNLPELSIITRVISLSLVFASFSAVIRTKLTIAVDFKTQAKVSLMAVSLSGVIGLVMAYNDFGVWSLIAQSLINTVTQTLLLFYFVNWRPKFMFSIDSFKSLFSFSSRLVLSQLISTVYANLYALVIGKQFNSYELGVYSRGESFSQFPSATISNVLSRVTFPLLSSISEDDIRLKGIYMKYIKFTSFIVFPIMFFLIAVASPLVELLLTNKWIDTVIILQILCLGFMWDPIGFLNINLLYIKGKPQSILNLEIVKKLVAVLILFSSISFGLTFIAVGRACYSFMAVFINIHFTRKLINFGYVDQFKLVFPYFCLSLTMGSITYYLSFLISNLIVKLVFSVIFSFSYYTVFSYLFGFGELKIIADFVRSKRKR